MNWSDWIAIAAFSMSAITWIHEWISNKEHVEMRALYYMPMPNNQHALYVTIENRSKSPLLLSKIILFNARNNCYIESYVFSKEVYRITQTKGKETFEVKSSKTIPLPISLPGNSGISGYLEFADPQQNLTNLSTVANFQLHTSRGHSFEFALKPERTLTPHQMSGFDIP